MANLIQVGDDLPAIAVPASLDGSAGTNRGPRDRRQVAADTDIEALGLWLAEYAGSPHTLRAYRKEVVRLLAWSTQELGKPVSSLTREDLLVYERFLGNPSAAWTDQDLPRRGAARRLFDKPLSPASARHAMGILSNLFNYLVAGGYLAGNPLALRRLKGGGKRARRAALERYLDHALWRAVLAAIETLPRTTRSEQQHYERARWLIRLFHGTGLRLAEAAQAKSADLVQRRGKWWLNVVGKGEVEGDIPVSDELMADFARYRRFYGMPATPSALENTPLVMSVAGRPNHFLTSTAVYLVVKEVFRHAAEQLKPSDADGAEKLRRASTHWLRHTAATHQADAGTDLRFIQKNLRHASLDTTSIYLHAEDDLRHKMTTGNGAGKPGSEA